MTLPAVMIGFMKFCFDIYGDKAERLAGRKTFYSMSVAILRVVPSTPSVATRGTINIASFVCLAKKSVVAFPTYDAVRVYFTFVAQKKP